MWSSKRSSGKRHFFFLYNQKGQSQLPIGSYIIDLGEVWQDYEYQV